MKNLIQYCTVTVAKIQLHTVQVCTYYFDTSPKDLRSRNCRSICTIKPSILAAIFHSTYACKILPKLILQNKKTCRNISAPETAAHLCACRESRTNPYLHAVIRSSTYITPPASPLSVGWAPVGNHNLPFWRARLITYCIAGALCWVTSSDSPT